MSITRREQAKRDITEIGDYFDMIMYRRTV